MYVKVTNTDVQCDLCGQRPREREVYKSDNFLYLCSDCLKKLQAMPEEMKDSLEEYLMGNVI